MQCIQVQIRDEVDCNVLLIYKTKIQNLALLFIIHKFANTVEPLKRGQHGDEPFVLSREVVLFRRFLFLSLKMKLSSCLDTNTTNKRECN